MIVGLLHPGEMGAAVGLALQAGGHEVLWASAGRSEATRSRAESFRDTGTVAALGDQAELILSICPPHAALDVAHALVGFEGSYVDANAISPAHAREIAELHPRFVDGGIVGAPPTRARHHALPLRRRPPRRWPSCSPGRSLQARVVADASALKMAYAAWSKGTAALLLAIRDVARHVRRRGRLAAGRRRSLPAACRAPSGQPRRRAGGGSARWRRSPTRSRPPASPTASIAQRPRCTGRDPARGLAKRYGDRRVFSGVDLDLADGGFLLVDRPERLGEDDAAAGARGARGADRGRASAAGAPDRGYLGHEPLVYRELSPLENLTLFGRLYRIPERAERVGMLLERFGLWDVRHERVSTFSRGMQQRLGLCRVLLHEPSLLLLDEPYNALDAQGAELLDAVLDEPRTYVVATHEPQRVERRATERLAFA